MFLYYTQKQWGLTPEEVDPSGHGARARVPLARTTVTSRTPTRACLRHGYTPLFERMLDHENISVCLNTEAESVFDLEFESDDGRRAAGRAYACQGHGRSNGPIVYTGPLDELFLSRFGRLPYRSLDFAYETHDADHMLPCGTVNFTVTEDYTRITEFKHLDGADVRARPPS